MEKKQLKQLNNPGYWSICLFVVITAGVLSICSCKKSGDCFSNTGEIIKEERRVGDFDSIDVRNYVNLILIQDSVNKVVTEAGKNIISGITTEVRNNTLYIDNTLNCNWLRSYSKPLNVYIYAKNFSKIYYLSSGNITNSDTLRSSYLKIDIWGGCGNINLKVAIWEGYFIEHMGTADVELHGRCPFCSIYAGDFGFFQCKDLRTRYNYVTNNGSNDCYVSSDHYLDVTLKSIGNIYYTGIADSLETKITGSGKLIRF
ncbi:MAG: DUF2807 domain-containing protein [Bacteroidetes bacterium]|nr:DUF2807 domain-containing protein [Bacteroidota bacterium]